MTSALWLAIGMATTFQPSDAASTYSRISEAMQSRRECIMDYAAQSYLSNVTVSDLFVAAQSACRLGEGGMAMLLAGLEMMRTCPQPPTPCVSANPRAIHETLQNELREDFFAEVVRLRLPPPLRDQ